MCLSHHPNIVHVYFVVVNQGEGDLQWFHISSGYQIYHILAPMAQNPFFHKTFPGASKEISYCAKFKGSSCLIFWFPKFRLCETTQCSSPLIFFSDLVSFPPYRQIFKCPVGMHIMKTSNICHIFQLPSLTNGFEIEG